MISPIMNGRQPTMTASVIAIPVEKTSHATPHIKMVIVARIRPMTCIIVFSDSYRHPATRAANMNPMIYPPLGPSKTPIPAVPLLNTGRLRQPRATYSITGITAYRFITAAHNNTIIVCNVNGTGGIGRDTHDAAAINAIKAAVYEMKRDFFLLPSIQNTKTYTENTSSAIIYLIVNHLIVMG
jgi:hypothetical protein